MIFNGISKDYLTVKQGVKRPAIAPIEYDIKQNPRVGGRIRKTQLKPLEIQVPVFLTRPVGLSWEDIKADLSTWLFHKEDKELTFKSFLKMGVNRHYMARLNDIDLDEEQDFAEGTISFTCQNPFRFSPEKTINLTTTTQTFTVGGQESTPWISKTVFSASANKFEFETNKGGKIILNFNFIVGDVLTIDYNKRQVRLNGNDLAISIDLATVWFELEPGIHLIKASHNTELTYSERYY